MYDETLDRSNPLDSLAYFCKLKLSLIVLGAI